MKKAVPPSHLKLPPVPPAPKSRRPPVVETRKRVWDGFGGRGFTLSILIHAALLVLGILWVFQSAPPKAAAAGTDFLIHGGGGGSPEGRTVSYQKPAPVHISPPSQRISAKGSSSSLALPEMEPGLVAPMSLTGAGALLPKGLGGSGSGGGLGSGNGQGIGSGSGRGMGVLQTGAHPFAILMFGVPVRAATIGFVLDVSGSMSQDLPGVLKELERAAPGSPVVICDGCSLIKEASASRIRPTRELGKPSQGFKDFRSENDFVFNEFKARDNSYFVTGGGTEAALLARELDHVEAVYWFSDFRDQVDPAVAEKVAENLSVRKQRLYVHPVVHGSSLRLVEEKIVVPTGGEVVEVR